MGVCDKGQDNKRFWLIKENQISPVKEFSAFLYMGRCQSLGSLKPFLWQAPQLCGANIACFLIPRKLRADLWEWLQSDSCQMPGILCFLPGFPEDPPAQQHTFGGGCLAAATDDCDTAY